MQNCIRVIGERKEQNSELDGKEGKGGEGRGG